MTRFGRTAAVLLAAGLGATLAVAVALGLVASAGQGYWAVGYYRLLAAGVWERFDVPALVVVGAVLAGAAAAVRLGRLRGPGPRPVRAAVAVLFLVGGLRLLGALDAVRAGRGPNVVLISIDTLRADRLGAYGYGRPTSPTIDRRLAAAGVTVEEVYSQSPKTTPSHMTMLTSLYPSVHGIEMWDGDSPGRVLAPRVTTLAEALKNAGWATAAFTGGTNVHRSRGFDQGFDVYRHSAQLRRAARWIARHRGRKVFLFFHTYAVHDPYLPPPDLIARFAPAYDGPVRAAIARLRADPGGWQRAHDVFWASVEATEPRDVAFVSALYDAGIAHMDATVMAPFLDLVDGLDGETLVVLTSDHGEAFAEHGRFLHGDLFGETLRVPLVVRFPGRLPAGRRVRGPAAVIDVMPTILDLVGVPAPPGLQGRSLAPLLAGAADAAPVDTISEYGPGGRVYARLRRGDLTYIADGPRESLFDAGRDPREQEDLAPTHPDLVEPLRRALRAWRAACRPPAARFGPDDRTVRPDGGTLERLRALGYAE